QLGRASAALDQERKKNGLLPSVSLSASVGYAGREPFELTDQAINRTGSGSITVTVPLDPFIPGSDGALGRSESQRRIEIAEYRLESAEDQLSRSLRNAVDGAQASATQIEVVERNAELAERVYQIAQERFEAGAIDALELQNSEVERTRARVAVIEQRLTHVQSLIEVEYLLGVDLEDLPW
ncbi:MAG TPA: TolC family protein, partial [Alkalispirochaeta sp.]|nr:TolC family protein [Alkalispirochaeta sp.]